MTDNSRLWFGGRLAALILSALTVVGAAPLGAIQGAGGAQRFFEGELERTAGPAPTSIFADTDSGMKMFRPSTEGGVGSRLAAVPITFRLRGQLQLRFLGTSIEDGDDSGTFLVPRTRVSASGNAYEDFGYAIQLDLTNPTGATLLDANLRYRLAPMATLWMGRGKAPFGRQQINSSRDLHFVDRNIVSQRFAPRRQQGVSLLGQNAPGTFEYQVGVYNGETRFTTPGNPFSTVGRVVWTPFGAYAPVESAHDYPKEPRLALGVAGLSFPNAAPGGGDITRMNVDVAYKVRGINMTGEFFREWDDSEPETLTSNGFYYQAGYLFASRRNELAGRIALIDTGEDFSVVEYGIAHSRYMVAHLAKVQTDLRYIDDERPLVPNRFEFRTQLQIAF